MPDTSASGSGLPSQPGDPTPQSMLRAMSSGHAYIREDHWSRFRAEQNAEDTKSSYERRIEDLERQALTIKSLSKESRLELEIQGVDRFKRSPAYDALLF
ncbi:hypothetical protein LWI29_024181 [Acer saccharum]|uniref:Uncharacterized protein n=1 Tax=Acer saccharum TaxID=4024 RepID=A0AA39RI62_ACESA|nr:hypothetical protein LWI29_024181 [Acer saccharum]